ncbi:ATP-binding protein [Micromonospora eburnea]|uniref:ATP-binding protein n=1 Tax=Micromonospora eburnea TaxID=227316 RepID=UPI001ABF5C42|nr:ATP-binding protein [Micromonospora eburnea]
MRDGDLARAGGLAALAVAVGGLGAWAYANTGASPSDWARDLAVGLSFATAGLVARWRRPGNPVWLLLYLDGVTWFLGNFQGTRVPALFAVGAWLEALNMAILVHLLLAFPYGRLGSRAPRALVGAGYALVAAGGLVRATVLDPATSSGASYLSCPDCGPNALLLVSDADLFTTIDLAYRGLGGVLTVAALVLVVRRWLGSSPVRRRALLPVWAAALVAVAFLGWDVAYLLAPGLFEAPGQPVVLLASDVSEVAVPFAFLVLLLHVRLRHAELGNLVIEISGTEPDPQRLHGLLVRVLGDASLRLGVWHSGTAHYLDPHGRRLDTPPPGDPAMATYVDGRGQPLALLVHDPALGDDPQLLAAASAAVRLAVENSRLHGQVAAGTVEAAARAAEAARAASARILRSADQQRRQLERDLHDGAQTRLVLALMTLRQLDARLAGGTDTAIRQSVSTATQTLHQALDDLRDLAQGIHPALLTREGLSAAVLALAQRAAVPVVVSIEPGRHPAEVEATAYFAICEALSNAMKHARARAVTVTARCQNGRLVVEVTDDGVGGADPAGGTGLAGLADRVAALAGVLEVTSPLLGGTRLRVELPCE